MFPFDWFLVSFVISLAVALVVTAVGVYWFFGFRVVTNLYNITVKTSEGWRKYRKLSELDLSRIRVFLSKEGVVWQYMNVYRRQGNGVTEFVKRIWNE